MGAPLVQRDAEASCLSRYGHGFAHNWISYPHTLEKPLYADTHINTHVNPIVPHVSQDWVLSLFLSLCGFPWGMQPFFRHT
jgi:hypothetical protein